MVPLDTVFIGLVIFFGLVGALRGWAKELLVTFSVILARFIENVLRSFIPIIGPAMNNLAAGEPKTWFYVRLALFIFITFFGYSTPTLSSMLGSKARKEKFQDTLLGFFLGIVNGFLVIGVFWGFLADMGYNIWGITPPQDQLALGLLKYLPTVWLQGGLLYVAVAVAFAFVLIVFI